MSYFFNQLLQQVQQKSSVKEYGFVTAIQGLLVYAQGLPTTVVGSRCLIEDMHGHAHMAEVVGYRDGSALLMPFGSLEGIGPNSRVYVYQKEGHIFVNDSYLGRVVNAIAEPIDGKGALDSGGIEISLKQKPPSPGLRQRVGDKLDVGVRAMNVFVPLCKGQRMGVFAGSGVGKSVLMGMMAKFCAADIIVIGLVGERGREVREFIDEQLGEEGLARSVVVVATGDEPPLMRRQAAYLSMSIAEYFRTQGKNVMLFMDSVTRFSFAQREIGLAVGEPPTTRGFTPSVFSELPRLLERAGPGAPGEGTITAIFTVLVEGGDMDEPVADSVRGIVDGHILLDRGLAERGHFPAIDVLKSVSRMLPGCHSPEELEIMNQARILISDYRDMEELIRLGAYARGSDPKIDKAIEYHDALTRFLMQKPLESATVSDAFATLGNTLVGAEVGKDER